MEIVNCCNKKPTNLFGQLGKKPYAADRPMEAVPYKLKKSEAE